MSDFLFSLPLATPPAPPETSTPTSTGGIEAIDHQQAAIDRLPFQFRGKPNIEAILQILTAPMNVLEQALLDLLTKRAVDTAVGAQLDLLGKIVGQPRNEVSDDEIYRAYIRARIATNKSNGVGDDVLKIARLVLAGYASSVAAYGTLKLKAKPRGYAAYALVVEGVDLTWELADILVHTFLEAATGAGIRVVLQFVVQHDLVYDDHDSAFTLGDVLSAVTDGLGLGDSLDPATGGVLSAAME